MDWIKKNVALIVAVIAVALAGSALGLAIANDGHSDKKHEMHHMKHMRGDRGMAHGGAYPDGAMHERHMGEPGMGEPGMGESGMRDHSQHAKELAAALAADGVKVTPEQLEKAMEAEHGDDMGSSSPHDQGMAPRDASPDMP